MTVETPIDPAASWRDRDSELVAPCYARYTDLVVESAQGSHLHTVDGRSIIDFGCGIGVTNLGHGHPAVVAAVHEQVDRLWHTSVTALHPKLVEAAEALISVTPDELDQVFLCNSGAEAVEASIKLARKATGRTEIIAFHGAFHGRTYGALSLTASKAKYRSGMGPFLPGIHHVPYPHCLRECDHAPGEHCRIANGEYIEGLFSTRAPRETVAAIIVEPLLGEGGYVVPPAEFLPRLRQICDTNGILLIADEVQSGFGRTGRMWAFEHSGVVPDIVCVAKAMGNGLPIAGIISSNRVMSHWHPGDHGTTYGGNPVACAAAVAVIETLKREGLVQRAATLGAELLTRLRKLSEELPLLVDVRGRGLMIGLEFLHPDRMPAPEVVADIRRRALAGDLLLLSCGIDDNVIRLVPPLNISEEDLETAMTVLERSIREACA
jgi:4-aminobutyrate aminotransferase